MALTLGDNFSYQGSKPLDGRLKYDTLANMKAVADATMYDGCMAYCVATDKTYQWKSTNTVDADTGRWREFSSGGGGTTDYSDLTNKPSINGNTLSGNKTGSSLGLQNQTLSSAITICGQSKTNVEDALSELAKHFNVVNGAWTYNNSGDYKAHALEVYYYRLANNQSLPNSVAYPPLPFGLTKTPSETSYIAFKVGKEAGYSGTAKASVMCFVYFTYQSIDYCKLYGRNCIYTGSQSYLSDWYEIGAAEEITAGTGLQKTNSEMAIKSFDSSDMADIVTPLPSSASKYMNYSLEEQVVGQWIDGKTIYEKVVNFGALPNATNKSVAHGISNFNAFVGIDGWASDGTWYIPINHATEEITSNNFGIRVALDATYINVYTAKNLSTYNGYFILRYTKTT